MIQSKRFGVVVVALAFVLMTAAGAWSQGDDNQPGWLGVTIQEVTKDLRDALPRGTDEGVLINDVVDGSPAEKAGLKDGDLITRFDRKTIRSTDDLTRAVRDAGAGTTVSLEYYRDGRRMRDRVTLDAIPKDMGWSNQDDDSFVWVDKDGTKHALKDGKYKVTVRKGDEDEPEITVWDYSDDDTVAPDEQRHKIVIKKGDDDEGYLVWPGPEGKKLRRAMEAPEIQKRFAMKGPGDLTWIVGDRPKLGVMLMDLGDQLADYFGAKDGGVLVSEVVKDSPADKAGLKAGDVIAQVDGKAVEDAADVRKHLRDAEAGDQVKIGVIRDHRSATYDVTIEESDNEWSDAGSMPDVSGLLKRFHGGEDFDFDTPAPNIRKFEFRGQSDEMKSDLDELRQQIKELRKELSDLKSRKP